MYMLMQRLVVDIENIITAETRKGHLVKVVFLRIETKTAPVKSKILIPDWMDWHEWKGWKV